MMDEQRKIIKKHFEDQFSAWIKSNSSDPVVKASLTAFQLYADKPIALTSSLQSLGFCFKRGTRGFTLNLKCLTLFPDKARTHLIYALTNGSTLVSIKGWTFTLPSDRFRYLEKKDDNQIGLYED